jgi:hypothetical protein
MEVCHGSEMPAMRHWMSLSWTIHRTPSAPQARGTARTASAIVDRARNLFAQRVKWTAGRHVRAFQAADHGAEVTHAQIYHSGLVVLAYRDPATPPKVLLTTWSKSLLDTSPEPAVVMNGGEALVHCGAQDMQEYTCMVLQVGPPLRCRGELYARPLQVRCSPFFWPFNLLWCESVHAGLHAELQAKLQAELSFSCLIRFHASLASRNSQSR